MKGLTRSVLIGGLVGMLACSSAAGPDHLSPRPGPQALLSPTLARFSFPAETARRFSWDIPRPGAYEGSPEHLWEVFWDPARLGTDPDAISAVVRWRPGGPRSGNLDAVVRAATLEVGTYVLNSEPGMSATSTDPDLRVQAQHGRVIIEVVGAAAIRRLFPILPDTVRFLVDDPYADPIAVAVTLLR